MSLKHHVRWSQDFFTVFCASSFSFTFFGRMKRKSFFGEWTFCLLRSLLMTRQIFALRKSVKKIRAHASFSGRTVFWGRKEELSKGGRCPFPSSSAVKLAGSFYRFLSVSLRFSPRFYPKAHWKGKEWGSCVPWNSEYIWHIFFSSWESSGTDGTKGQWVDLL